MSGMSAEQPLRLAMWSGPRNISTAMMRAWGNRADTFVCDEPLYAHYLQATGLPHPGREEVIARHEPDWRKVVAWLTGPVPDGRRVFFQKHMSHHLLPELDRDWLARLTHAFLIRDPREMLTSLIKVTPSITLSDTGLPQQVELIRFVEDHEGATPPILDARDVLEDPRGMLTGLCQRVGIEFTETMLSWPAGPRATDGVWAKHWYAAVEKSTGFEPYRAKQEIVPPEYAHVLAQSVGLYERMHRVRMRASGAA